MSKLHAKLYAVYKLLNGRGTTGYYKKIKLRLLSFHSLPNLFMVIDAILAKL